jgi:hypothetical protein
MKDARRLGPARSDWQSQAQHQPWQLCGNLRQLLVQLLVFMTASADSSFAPIWPGSVQILLNFDMFEQAMPLLAAACRLPPS